MWVRALVALAAFALGAASPAFADRATADALARQAEAAAGSGDMITAATKFRAAFAADPRPELQCNAGVAYYKLGDLPRAELYLGDCAQHSTELATDFLAKVHNALASVESVLPYRDVTPVDITVEPRNAAITIELWPEDPISGSHRVWLAYGHHTLQVSAPGYVTQTLAIEAAGKQPIAQTVTLQLVPPPTLPPGGGDLPFGVTRTSQPPAVARVLVYTGAGLLAAGIGFHIAAEDVRGVLQTAHDDNNQAEWDAHNGNFEALRAATIGCYAAAALAGGVGAYLWLRHGHERVPVALAVTPHGAAAALRW